MGKCILMFLKSLDIAATDKHHVDVNHTSGKWHHLAIVELPSSSYIIVMSTFVVVLWRGEGRANMSTQGFDSVVRRNIVCVDRAHVIFTRSLTFKWEQGKGSHTSSSFKLVGQLMLG